MKKTVFLRSTLRQPIRNLFILLIVGVVSFALISRVGEYVLVQQEAAQLSGYYRSVGDLMPLNNATAESSGEMSEYIENAPHVAYTQRTMYASGVMQDDLYSIGLSSGFSFTFDPSISPDDVFFYGIYSGQEVTEETAEAGRYIFSVDDVVSGFPEYVAVGKSLTLFVDVEQFGDLYTQLKPGERYLIRATNDTGDARCYDPTLFRFLIWKPLASDLPWYMPAPSNVDLSLPEYTQFLSEIKQSRDNACALILSAIVDTNIISYIQDSSQKYYIMDGRWPSYEDHLAGNRVIVIHEALATARNLEVGDSLTLRLRNIPFSAGGWLQEKRPVGQEEAEASATETFEIIGIFRIAHSNEQIARFAQFVNGAFIPLSVLPENFEPTFAGEGSVESFVLDSPEYEQTFLAETADDLAQLGHQVIFRENGYENFKNAVSGILISVQNNMLIFGGILIAALILAAFVYFRFRRKDLAISRALGVPAGTCIPGSVLPLVLVGGIGIVVGSVLAWNYTQSNAETLLAALVEAASAEGATATLPMNMLVILDVILIIALLVLVLIFATVTVKRPVLSQLQGGKNRK